MAANHQQALGQALAALELGVAKPDQAPRLTYAEARADQEARARAGQTYQSHDMRGCFTKGVKGFTVGKAPAAPVRARKVVPAAAVEAPRPARDRAPASGVALSVEV